MTLPRPKTDEERRHLLRYTKPELWPVLDRFGLGADLYDQILADLLDCSPARVRALSADLDAAVSVAAGQLVADAELSAALPALPFRAGDRVVAVGDSLTADRLGWVEILRAALRVAGHQVEIVNLGVSGNTTADVLERFDLVAAARPTHMLMMLGTNDVRRHGRPRSHRMVTVGETRRNLLALIELIDEGLGVPVTLITPPPADQRRVLRFFDQLPLRWDAADLAGVAAVVRSVDPGCIDVQPAFDDHGVDCHELDGVHLSPAGQQLLARTILWQLAISTRRSQRDRADPAGAVSATPTG